MKQARFTPRPVWVGASLCLVAGLLWGGKHAYCHFYGSMAASNLQAKNPAPGSLLLVAVTKPVRRTAVRSITLPASVEAFEKATLYAKVFGYLRWIRVDKGDRVRKGDVLALVEVPEIEQEHQRARAAVQEAQANYERAQADAALKELTYKRLEGIRQSEPDVISPQEIDVARAAFEVAQGDSKLAEARLELAQAEVGRLEVLINYAKIRAPFSGIVSARYVDPGALIQSPGGAIVTVAGMDRVRIYADVPEPGVPYVRPGEPAEVNLDALPGKTFSGRIERIATALDPQSRTMKVEVDLPNPGYVIRPGMFGRVILSLGEEAAALFLPAEALHQDAEGNKYVTIVADGRVRMVRVETGLDDGGMIQVRGLRGDEDVVVGSSETLREGLRVRIARVPS